MTFGHEWHAAVVSDSWAQGDYLSLSRKHHAEIVALGRSAEVILTTGRLGKAHRRGRARHGGDQKPYDLDRLLAAVRLALERASISGCRSGPSAPLERPPGGATAAPRSGLMHVALR